MERESERGGRQNVRDSLRERRGERERKRWRRWGESERYSGNVI